MGVSLEQYRLRAASRNCTLEFAVTNHFGDMIDWRRATPVDVLANLKPRIVESSHGTIYPRNNFSHFATLQVEKLAIICFEVQVLPTYLLGKELPSYDFSWLLAYR